MDETAHYLDHESERALVNLVGSQIQTLLSQSCDIAAGESVLEVRSVSIQIGARKFIVVESEWGDTPNEGIDYHMLAVRTEREPRGIYYNNHRFRRGWSYRDDHLTVHLGALATISSVEVLQTSDQGATESVVYDSGLLITRSDGLRFVILCSDSIVGALSIGHTPSDIEEMMHEMTVRARYGA